MSLSISVALIFFSWKKGNDERNDANKPPNRHIRPDHVITLPTDSILLVGSASNDPDGTMIKLQTILSLIAVAIASSFEWTCNFS